MKRRKDMNTLLIFFALPIATIIISIALQKILKNPILVAAVVFAIYLIVTFIINNLNFLIATIVYTIISYITAIIVCLICRLLDRLNNRENNCRCRQRDCNSCEAVENNNAVLTIDGDFQNNGSNGVFAISALNNSANNNSNCGCNSSRNSNNCGCNNSNNNGVSARINVIPNSNTNGRTGCLCGNYRRR